LLEVKRGAKGGSRVLPAGAGEHISVRELRKEARELAQVMEFRMAVECAAADGAARARTSAEAELINDYVEQLERLLEGSDTRDAIAQARITTKFLELDHRFHLAVAAASHNQYLLDAV